MPNSTATTIVRSDSEGDAHWFFNGLMTTKATMAETLGAYSLSEYVVTEACNPPMHIQVDEEEAFYILDGEVEFEVAGEVVVATPGTFALVGRGVTHRYSVLTPTARMLVICSGKPTDNLELFFTAMGEPAAERVLPTPTAPDTTRLAALCRQTGIELVP